MIASLHPREFLKEFELEDGELVVRETRRHWLLFVVELLPYASFAILPLAIPKLFFLLAPATTFTAAVDFSTALMRAAYGIWLLVVWTAAWGAFTRYYLNAWVLTNLRIVTIKQQGYFSREVSSVLLNRVQDVTTEVHGVLASFLDIGNINVQSAGALNEFHMQGIPYPGHMRDLILKHVPDSAEQKVV
jgi:hypothetical protein